ncbi:uncharacterized protein LOC130430660 [Triplophysa dalaica]|uniref:uncharacterized protein LOC130430660 n=1 Tax=Triplophysa dalaica TaxID=1582913 RepID=UPI0024DF908B|nr:uncharacterized protein LOC130430660 [Triplophysa dalaica]
MASPAKVQKADENTLEGFLFSVSPRRESKNGNPFFRAVLQSARQEYHGVVFFFLWKASVVHAGGKERQRCETAECQAEFELFRSGWLRHLVFPFYQHGSDEPAVSPLCAAELQEALTIAEVKALGPKEKVGEVFGKVKLNGSVSKVVHVNCSDCELKEIVINDGTGYIKVTLWDPFANVTKAMKSYAFKNLCTRDRGEFIYLRTGPSCVVEPITDFTEAEDESETSQQESRSTALLSAKVKGVEITIQRRCPSCRARQTAFIEKSVLHRCEGCRLKQSSLAFVASFSGKGHSRDGQQRSQCGHYQLGAVHLLAVGRLCSMLNDAEAIEDHLLVLPGLDLTINADWFLLSIQRAVEPPAPSEETLNNSDEFLQEMLELAEIADHLPLHTQPVVLPAPEETLSEVSQLSKVGGRNNKDCVHKVMDMLFTNSLMAAFNMKGRGPSEKKAFQDTVLYSVVKAAACEAVWTETNCSD